MTTLTEDEISALSEKYNLADGHAYRAWSTNEAAVVSRVSELFSHADRSQKAQIEADYLRAYFALSRQSFSPESFEAFFCFTASTAIEVAANLFRQRGSTVALIEPCFDNIHNILARHGVDLISFPEELMCSDSETLESFLSTLAVEALFLVSPNNPTGRRLPSENLATIVRYCKARNVTLVLDTCFRFYLPESAIYDEYMMLIESGIEWIVIEDTGKTWPTREIKGPFFSVSRNLAARISHIYSDFILHVPPFALMLVGGFINSSIADDRSSVMSVIAANRRTLYRDLVGTYLVPCEADFMSVSWVRVDAQMSSSSVKHLLEKVGVHTLAGNQFFWRQPRVGGRFLRIALCRDADLFQEASARIAQVCRKAGENK